MSDSVKVNGNVYPITVVSGKTRDADWDNRDSLKIEGLTMTCSEAASIFTDNAAWSIVTERVSPTTGEVTTEEYDKSGWQLAGDITDHRDGTVDVKMGKPTDLENALELLLGGDE